MPAGFSRYIITALLLSLICAALSGWAASAGFLNLSPAFRYSPLLFFFLLSVSLHYYLIRSTEGRPQKFVTAFMGVQALKMFVHLMAMVIAGILFPKIAVHFILVYAVYYLAFTVVETISLMRLFSKK
jgi:hypothetical protein